MTFPITPEEEERAARYSLKGSALVDVINNGKTAPNPIPPLVGRTFTMSGKTITIHAASLRADLRLFIDVTINGVRNQYVITNPPVIPRTISGNERQDLIQAASEMIAHLPVA